MWPDRRPFRPTMRLVGKGRYSAFIIFSSSSISFSYIVTAEMTEIFGTVRLGTYLLSNRLIRLKTCSQIFFFVFHPPNDIFISQHGCAEKCPFKENLINYKSTHSCVNSLLLLLLVEIYSKYLIWNCEMCLFWNISKLYHNKNKK